jgi:hypothetical protein
MPEWGLEEWVFKTDSLKLECRRRPSQQAELNSLLRPDLDWPIEEVGVNEEEKRGKLWTWGG